MENRFFDIDSNVYLNGLYIFVLISEEQKMYKLDDINLKLFLMKNPHIMMNVCKKFQIEISMSYFDEFQFDNYQVEMSKYVLKVQVKGLMESISFLYSKGLLEMNLYKGIIQATQKCIKLRNEKVPERIFYMANKINKLFAIASVKDIKKALFVEGDNLHE